MNQVLAIGMMNYLYKLVISLAITPLLYLIHNLIDKYLGKELSNTMMKEADGTYTN